MRLSWQHFTIVIQDLTINQNNAEFTWVELARDVLAVEIAMILRLHKEGNE
jgi:hypothetical protein